MQVNEIVEKINFHDGNVIGIFHQNDVVKLKVDLCMWNQRGYKEGDDELKEILLEFTDVSDYIWDSEKSEAEIDYDTILEVSYYEGLLKFVLQDNVISVLTFKSNTVKIE